MDYPPDWPCQCGHRRDEHGPLPENDTFFHHTKKLVCLLKKRDGGWKDNCYNFNPIDNLTYVEQLAKENLK